MTQLNPHQQYLLEEFAEDYLARQMSRRDMIRRSLYATGSVALTATTLFALGCGSGDDDTGAGASATPTTTAPEVTTAPTTAAGGPPGAVAENDPAITAQDVTFQGTGGTIFGYLARPSANGTYPGIIVIHENRGLLPHFKDVSRRYAKQGFVALAVDLASRLGGTATAGQQLGQVRPEDAVADLQSGLDYLKAQSYVKATALGVTGFCFGGGYAFDLAAASPDIKAAVPYYGTAMRALGMGLSATKAAVHVMYGETDTRLTEQRVQVEPALQQSGRPYMITVHAGAGHAFFNDTGGSYNEKAATDAWNATLAWFRMHLG
jgi:carboxymethylenebutenolidase